jgi:hypothetical protein
MWWGSLEIDLDGLLGCEDGTRACTRDCGDSELVVKNAFRRAVVDLALWTLV